MKFAVIADVHGNSRALRAVLAEIDKDPQIEAIYCLGDLICIGHETNEVLEILSQQKSIFFVKGNHDRDIAENRCSTSDPEELLHYQWVYKQMDPRFLPFLRKIPFYIELERKGKRMLFVHYHLREEGRFFSLDWGKSKDHLLELYADSGYDLICFGHDHAEQSFLLGRTLFFNPGSLGCSHDEYACYGVISIDGDRIVCETKRVIYDRKSFLEGFFHKQVPAKETILHNFYGIKDNC